MVRTVPSVRRLHTLLELSELVYRDSLEHCLQYLLHCCSCTTSYRGRITRSSREAKYPSILTCNFQAASHII
uniref:Uncharacterized protein n=1 Tax=Oryza brachyantha TaxID=4533 RepID=J3MUS4_ORYBR